MVSRVQNSYSNINGPLGSMTSFTGGSNCSNSLQLLSIGNSEGQHTPAIYINSTVATMEVPRLFELS